MTIVEVVIGAIIISTVLVAVVMTLTSAGQAQQRSKVRQQMASSADGTLEAMRAEKSWLAGIPGGGCGAVGCPVTLDAATLERVTKGREGREFGVAPKAWPVDSDGDGIGVADADRVVPDYVRVEVTVTMSQEQQDRFGRQRPLAIVSTIDMGRHGAATGTLVVQTCEASNQIDERASIESCDQPLLAQPLAAQPTPCRTNALLSFLQLLADRRSLAIGCNAALAEVQRETPSMARMTVRPVSNLAFVISLTNEDGTRVTRRSIDSERDAARGRHTFSDIPAGTWSIVGIVPAAGREFWASKSIPSSHAVTVPPNGKSKALLVQRVTQGRGSHTTTFTRTIHRYRTTHPQALQLGHGNVGGVRIIGRATFHYDLVLPAGSPVVPGSAWNGLVVTEAKPAGRYIAQAGGLPAQRRAEVRWAPIGSIGTASVVFQQLSSGLQAKPDFLECTSEQCGEQVGSNRCDGPAQTPGQGSPTQVPCTDEGVWIDQVGNSNTTTNYHSPKGECYLDGDLVRGGRPRTRGPCNPIVRVNEYQLRYAYLEATCGATGTNRTCSTKGPKIMHVPDDVSGCFKIPEATVVERIPQEEGPDKKVTTTGVGACLRDPH